MKRVWIIIIVALLMIATGCGKTAEIQEMSLPEEISTGISIENQDGSTLDDSSLFQPVERSEQNMDQQEQADTEIVDIEAENDRQKEPTDQTDQGSPFQGVNEAAASKPETQGPTGSQEKPQQDSPSDPPTPSEKIAESEADPIPNPPEETEEPEPDESVETPPEETEPAFDISYWISYAQSAAQAKGLQLESSAVDCWDNPITANPGCIYLERDITSRLSRYAADEDITDVWIWYESTGENSYLIYIGYA